MILFIKFLLSYLISQPRNIRNDNRLVADIWTTSKSDSLTRRQHTSKTKDLLHSITMNIHNKDHNFM